MKDFLFLIFTEMGLPFFRQGTLTDETMPIAFFTYWNIEDSWEFADNVPKRFKNVYSICCYCKTSCLIDNADYLDDMMDDFIDRARAYGLTVSYANDVASGQDDLIGKNIRVSYAKQTII